MTPTFLTPKNHTALAALFLSLSLGGCKGDDGNSDGTGGAGGAGALGCDSDSQCDDGLFCNGEEVCSGGFCRAGERLDCDDGIECTVDRCDEATQACVSNAPDEDGDGFGDSSCEDEDGAPLGSDCDDEDPLRFPGNVEICDPDNRDEDCDASTIGTNDSDNDGYVSATCCNEQSDGELLCGEDCDDFKTNVNPLATEVCDRLDNDCDGETDEDVAVMLYPDLDHDGHGDESEEPVATCAGTRGFANDNIDCDDTDPEVFEGQFEICDNKDNNCDGNIDEIEQVAPWYRDADGDTYGDANSTPVYSCYRVPGRVLSRNDCNDSLNTINPNATEICDALDNDCNGSADFKLAGVNNFEDDDGDGIADAECGGDDCNDQDARTGLGKEEVCDRIDNDCDGLVDEQTTQNIWYIDNDGDGWGVVLGSALASCDPIVGRASNYGDCDDSNNGIRPGVTDFCDGVDNDCDGLIDEGASAYCNIPNANPTCRAGQCLIFSCQAGFADADNNPANGCEANVTPTPNGDTCSVNADCTDGNLCNGFEYCSAGDCYDGTPINCQALQGVYEGDVTINSSSDLQALSDVDWITGDLVIGSGTPVTLLIGLENLRIVGGSVYIQNTNLTRLSGSALSGLESVGGDIVIENNTNLIDVNLPSLLSARSIEIRNNPKLKQIGGYGNLTVLDERLIIEQNSALENITGFNALTSVGDPSGDFFEGFGSTGDYGSSTACFDNGVIIRENFSVTQVPTFDALVTVAGDLCIHDVAGGSVELPVLEQVLANVSLVESALLDVSLPQLTSVLDFGYIGPAFEGTPLRSIDLPELTDAASIQIGEDFFFTITVNAPDLERIDIPKLNSTEFLYMDIRSITDLQSLNLNALQTVESSVDILLVGDTSQETIAFPALVYPGNYFEAAINLEGMTSLEFPNMTGHLEAQEATSFQISLNSDATTLQSLSLPSIARVEYLYINVLSTGLTMPQLDYVSGFRVCTGTTDQDNNPLDGDPTLLCDNVGLELDDILPVDFVQVQETEYTCSACYPLQQITSPILLQQGTFQFTTP